MQLFTAILQATSVYLKAGKILIRAADSCTQRRNKTPQLVGYGVLTAALQAPRARVQAVLQAKL